MKFIHTADIHFGMENYGKIDPETGIHTRLLDFEQALNTCIDRGIEEQIDFFLFAGDAYKTATPSPTQQKLLMRCLLRLHKAGIPIIIVVGNHDNPLSFGKANSLEIFGDIPLDGFHVIAKPTLLKLETKSGPVQIVGIPWPTRTTIALNKKNMQQSLHEITDYIAQAVSKIIEDFATKCDPTLPSVLSGHLTVSSGIFSGSEKRAIYGNDPTLMPSQLAIKPFDYVALGHLHRHQNLNPHGYPAVVYSGSIERVDFGERKEPKGFCLVSLYKDETTYEFIEVPTRPFIQIDVQLTSDKETHTQQILDALHKKNLSNAVVKIVYYVPAQTQDGVSLSAVERACADAHYLVSIIPVHDVVARQKRRGFLAEKDLSSLLTSYFQDKSTATPAQSLLIQKALDLYAHTQQEESE